MMRRLFIYLLFFLSGAAGLIYQLVWVRKLVLIFGNTTYATASILTAFMGGLALGSYLIGKHADRIKTPLKFYAYLEFGIGASAVAILFFFIPISDAVYVWLFHALGNNSLIFNIVRFLLSIIILIIPTTLMGGTLPVISKYFIKMSDDFGKRLGRLYGFNTLGAVIGAFLTGFLLISAFGVNTTLWIAVFLNLAIGITAFLLDDKKMEISSAKKKPHDNGSSHKNQYQTIHTDEISRYSQRTAKLAVWMFGIAGFVSLAYEVVFTRALIFFISSTTFSFTIILVTFLTGISLGSFVMSRWVDRLKRLLLWFSIFEIIIAVTAVLTIPLFLNLTLVQNAILAKINANNWNYVSLLLFASASIILILPTFFMGAVFPIVNRIYVKNITEIGQGVGIVYMANTIGAIFGSFMSGFIILPLIGLNNTILVLAIINLTIAVVLFFLENKLSARRMTGYIFPAAAVAAFCVIVLFTFTNKPLYLSTAGFQGTRLLHHKDTAAATISVLEKKDQVNIWGRNVRYLNVNGHNTAHTTFSDMIIHKMLAHLPMLLTPDPKEVLVVGFGFGNTCRSFLDYDFVEKVDCVELVSHEKKTAKYFKPENKGVFEDKRFNFIVNDGRNYILATQKKYDVISINSVDPKFSPTLYTEDFYELCRAKLNADGQLIVWLPIYGMTLEEVQALVKSFIDVFPNSSLWYNNPEHLLLCGIKGNYFINLARVKRRIESPAISASLGEIHLNDPYTFLSTFFCGRKMLHKFAGSVLSHSDNFPVVEFSRVPTNEMIPAVYEKLLQCRETVLSYSVDFRGWGEVEPARKKILKYETGMKNLIADFFSYRMFATNPKYEDRVEDTVVKMRKVLNSEPENDFALLQYVDLINHPDLAIDKAYFEKAIVKAPRFAKAFVLLG
ncbi:MAG: MFS transporter, partial [Actinobacteria bacterium]|nr:MFS transporter [Actinomycetota bacterium]